MASPSVDVLRKKLRSVWPLLDERARRLMAASEALALAYGGAESFARRGREPEEVEGKVAAFIDDRVSHNVLEVGELVLAYGGDE